MDHSFDISCLAQKNYFLKTMYLLRFLPAEIERGGGKPHARANKYTHSLTHTLSVFLTHTRQTHTQTGRCCIYCSLVAGPA